MLLSSVFTEFLSRFLQAFGTSVIEVFAEPVSFGMVVLGTGVLYLWHVLYGGPSVLDRAPVRRTRLSPLILLGLIFVYYFASYLVVAVIGMAFKGDTDSEPAQIATYLALVFFELLMIAGMLWIASHAFARRLKGLGLAPGTLLKDFRWSPVHLVAIYPLVLAGLWVVLFAGRLFDGSEFTMQAHQSLQTLTEADSLLLRWLIPLFAVLIVPVFEELLFRGFIQSSITAWTGRPWLAIAATSMLFAVNHPNSQHWVGLFFLSCGFGYAYERSGSLFRPIIMHLLFNGSSVTLVLLQQMLQNT